MIIFPGGVRQKRNFRRGGGVIGKIPSVGGYGYFLELHIVEGNEMKYEMARNSWKQ